MLLTTKALMLTATLLTFNLSLGSARSLLNEQESLRVSLEEIVEQLVPPTDHQQQNEEDVNQEDGVASTLYEGDIVLTRRQKEMLENGGRGMVNNQAFRSSTYFRWPGGVVPYELDNTLHSAARSAIYAAMNEIKQKTGGCVSFKKRVGERDYVRFFSGQGCWATLGRVGDRQDISIENDGCATKGIAIHEIFHALGRFHEQNRPDRDQYVKINFNNIQRAEQHNFNRQYRADDQSLPYDFSSVMHYGPYAFAINRRVPVISVKGGRSSNVRFGQREGLSDRDVQHLKKAYCRGNTGWSWLG